MRSTASSDTIFRVHFTSRAWMDLLTGDLRHLAKSFQFSIMNTKTKASQAQMRLRNIPLTIINKSGLYITILPEPGVLSSKTGDEAESEFGMEEVVFYQNGTWEYDNLTNEDNGYLVTADDLGMMPIYIGAPGEEKSGLCRFRKLLKQTGFGVKISRQHLILPGN